MNATLLSLSVARNINKTPVADLPAIQVEALAYAQDVGMSSAASASKRNSWQITAEFAVGVQGDQELLTVDLRKAALAKHKAELMTALRGEAIASMSKAQGFDKFHVAKGKDSDGNKHTSLKSLMVQAQKRVDNYYGRIVAAWDAGLSIESEQLAKGAGLKVEPANTLSRRTAEVVAAKTEPTPGDVVVRAFGQLAGDAGEAAENLKYKDQADQLAKFAEAVKMVVLRAVHGQLGAEDINVLTELLSSAGADAQPLDTDATKTLADEVRESLGIEPATEAA